jgi:hypothetical protein
MDDFEKQIQRQLLRQIPSEWRADILTAAQSVVGARLSTLNLRPSLLSTLNTQLSTVLWPHPKAWAGLAAVWILILALNFSTRDHSEIVAKKSAAPTPEVVAELQQQKLLFAQLIGSSDAREAEPPKFFPRPRTERIEILTA